MEAKHGGLVVARRFGGGRGDFEKLPYLSRWFVKSRQSQAFWGLTLSGITRRTWLCGSARSPLSKG